jgi:hypothetical protein
MEQENWDTDLLEELSSVMFKEAIGISAIDSGKIPPDAPPGK